VTAQAAISHAGKPPVLHVEDLQVEFATYAGIARVVDLEQLTVEEGEAFGLAGESGSGKSVTAQALLGLLPSPPGRIASGRVWLYGRDLRQVPSAELAAIRGRDVAMIFQDPLSSLNPVFPIGEQILRVIMRHQRVPRRVAREQALAMLDRVKMPEPEVTLGKYPHQLSGGMRQRVMCAIGLSCGSRFLIADEPTKGLDVTIQADVLKLMDDLRREGNLTLLFIANNLGVIARMCTRVAMMYAGQIVEVGDVGPLFRRPAHPYTRALLAALPSAGSDRRELATTGGFPPSPVHPPPGCRFHPRCPWAEPVCRRERPSLVEVGPRHQVACHLADQLARAAPAPGGGAHE
jgi:oligopeptide/dipeptide ABC transporter ATP-binding protein